MYQTYRSHVLYARCYRDQWCFPIEGAHKWRCGRHVNQYGNCEQVPILIEFAPYHQLLIALLGAVGMMWRFHIMMRTTVDWSRLGVRRQLWLIWCIWLGFTYQGVYNFSCCSSIIWDLSEDVRGGEWWGWNDGLIFCANEKNL